MRIDSVHVQNFKSISEIEVHFGMFNVLIGKNAAGKSNILELFQFLKDVGQHGLEDTIHLRGRIDYFQNTRIGSKKNFSLDCSFSFPRRRGGFRGHSVEIDGEEFGTSPIYSTDYELEIEFEDNKYRVYGEKITTSRHVSVDE